MKLWNDRAENTYLVFRLPVLLPLGYCFGDGLPVNFQMVDWFLSVVPDIPEPVIAPFIRRKTYYHENPGSDFLVVRNTGESFIVWGKYKSEMNAPPV